MAWAELSDVRCYYELRGQGEPLLLIPGLGGSCRIWDPIVPVLSQHFCLILMDNRGIGQSVARRPARDMRHLSADLVELLDHLQLDRAHVLGLSLGGIIAQKLATDHPSRVDRLVLVSCTDAYTRYLRQITLLLAQALRKFPKESFIRTVELLGTAPEYLDEHADELEAQVREKCTCTVPRRALADQLRCVASSDRDERDVPISAPTLVIAGEHDAMIPNCYGRRMAARIPGSEFEIIPGTGHNPFCECPDIVVPRIIGFLTRGRARGPSLASTGREDGASQVTYAGANSG